jgi:hypothetical protein
VRRRGRQTTWLRGRGDADDVVRYQRADAPLLTDEMTGEEPGMAMFQTATEDTIAIHTVENPAAGEVVTIDAGNRLDVRFTHVGLTSRWEVVEWPRNLVPLAIGRTSFSFLAFRSDTPVQDLVLRRTGAVRGRETRVIRIVTHR